MSGTRINFASVCSTRNLVIASLMIGGSASIAAVPRPDHVVIVMEENQGSGKIIGSANAPYINSLASGGAYFSNSHAITHPSQPNYLDLFSGNNQGITDDSTTPVQFTTANLGAQLISSGFSFTGYSESLPSAGYTGDTYSTVQGQNQYVRKHNPWVNWQSSTIPQPTNTLPASVNQPFTSFPSNFTLLPTVSFVIPNEQDDMHHGTIAQGDTWLKNNIDAYAQWSLTHNSLLIVTWDEDDSGDTTNLIPTIMYGGMINSGTYSESINHFNVLRTIEDMYGTSYAGAAATSTPITDVFVAPEPGTIAIGAASLLSLHLRPRRQSRRRRKLF
ncbi:MAG: acid phosphatase [Phycisphaerae bacterium]|nr:acid phosphatase [Phycisphaerae bacterium]